MKRLWCKIFAFLLLGMLASGCPVDSGNQDAGQDADQQQDGDGGECQVENCTPPENATAICNQGECDFECDDGFFRSGEACETCDTDEHCGPDCLPCDSGLTCCTDECVDLVTSSEHCGECGNACATLEYSCCEGQHCCHPTKSKCCPGAICCEDDGICCPEVCCPLSLPTCCGTGCCEGDAVCCHDHFCCEARYPICCENSCCPTAAPICCPHGCCETGFHCCETGCCPN